jgi:hypothetical protein
MNARDQRKQDLLLASQLLRLHAADAANELSARADRVQERVLSVVALWNRPPVRVAATALAAVWLARSMRSRQPARARRAGGSSRLLRWGIVGWRVWRIAAPTLTQWLQSSGTTPRAPSQGTSRPSI